MKDSKQEFIESYLNGELNRKEQSEFEKLLESDPKFREDFILSKELHEAMTDNDAVEVEQIMEKIIKKHKKVPLSTGKKWKFGLLFLVALGLLCLIYLLTINNTEPAAKSLYASYYEPYAAYGINRELHENKADLALLAYAEKNYKGAAVLYEELQSKTQKDAFYYAMTLMASGKMEDAISAFQVTKNDSDWRAQSLWYQSLALLNLDKTNEAKEKLGILRNEEGPYSVKADQLLKDLRK